MSHATTIAEPILANQADSLAICDPVSNERLSYRELGWQVNQTAALLKENGIERGTAVCVASGNSISLVITFLALAQCGAVFIPINPQCVLDEMKYFAQDSEACLFMVSEDIQSTQGWLQIAGAPVVTLPGPNRPDNIRPARRARLERFDDDACVMIYTSGTTSSPKGVPLTHKNLLHAVASFTKAFQLSDKDTALVPMPLFHVHGLIGITLSTLTSGGTVVLEPRFSASKFWQHVRDHKVTWYSASPTIHRILLARAAQDDIPRGQLRFVRSSSASLGSDTLEQLEEQFGTVVLEGYGMTEAANQISCNPLPPAMRKPGSVGIPQGAAVRVIAADGELAPANINGEIAVKGESITHGYHNRPELMHLTFRDGWLLTGDEGKFDQEGYLYISGRIKELINRGGEKVAPAEVEQVLLRHPQVVEAACFGMPDPKYGEEVEAAVVLRDGATVDDVLIFCKQYLNAIKIPKKIHSVEKIPRNSLNKVKRQELISQLPP